MQTDVRYNKVELNGRIIERDDIRSWLKAKRVSLWSDWCIGHPDSMEKAIDWFMSQMADLAGADA